MGKIIRNGIPYSGSSNSARSINYDNTNSGLEATTAQAAVDELNKKIQDIDVSGASNIVYLTKAQYDALPDSKLSDNVEYRITDAHTTNRIAAEDVIYGENTVAAAVDELNDNVELLIDNVDELSNSLGVDIKIIDGIPHWSERGADSWSPFSSGEGENAELVLLGTGNSFNIADIVGAENVGKYSEEDFVCVPTISDVLSNSYKLLNGEEASDVKYYVNKLTDPILVYDNTNGNVTIENAEITIGITAYDTGRNVGTDTHTWDVSSKVYLCVGRAGGAAPEIEIVPLVPTLTSNTGSDGGEVIVSTNYDSSQVGWTVFDNNVNTAWASKASQNSEYVGYKFAVPTCVKLFSIVPYGQIGEAWTATKYRIEGSNDNSTWDSLGEFTEYGSGLNLNNNNYYLYYRFYSITNGSNGVGLKELQFNGYQMEALVPPMTSNTTPSGIASASSVNGASTAQNTMDAYMAFNGTNNSVTNDCWVSGVETNPWLQYDFVNPVCVNMMYMENVNTTQQFTNSMKNFTVLGSNDGSKWDNLGNFTNMSNEPLIGAYYTINNNKKYYKYRVLCDEMYTRINYVCIGRLQFYAEPEGASAGSNHLCDIPPIKSLTMFPDGVGGYHSRLIFDVSNYTSVTIKPVVSTTHYTIYYDGTWTTIMNSSGVEKTYDLSNQTEFGFAAYTYSGESVMTFDMLKFSGEGSASTSGSEMNEINVGTIDNGASVELQLNKNIDDIQYLLVDWVDLYALTNMDHTRVSIYTKEKGWKNFDGRTASATGKTLTLSCGNGFASTGVKVWYI